MAYTLFSFKFFFQTYRATIKASLIPWIQLIFWCFSSHDKRHSHLSYPEGYQAGIHLPTPPISLCNIVYKLVTKLLLIVCGLF